MQGTPVLRTFTVANDGNAPLTLKSINPASLPAGFSLAQNFLTNTLGPGLFTTFQVQLDAVSPGNKSGSFSFANNDADENPFDIGLTGTVLAREVVVSRSSGPQTITVSAVDDLVYEGSHSGTITHSAASSDAGYQGLPVSSVSVQIADNEPPTLSVSALVPTDSGLIVAFNRPIAAGDLNLYDAQAGTLGPVDLTLTGAAGGAVRGSLIAAAGNPQFTFLKTGGPLAVDTYTVVLRSAASGFHDVPGVLLDGDANGLAGGDYTTNFVVAAGGASEVAIGVPDFARGFGQAVNLPLNTTLGIPITLSTGQDLTSAAFDLAFDLALLSVTGFTTSIVGAAPTFTVLSPGLVRVTVTSATQFSSTSGAIELGRLAASVPATAPYASKAVLDLTNVAIADGSGPRPVRVDDGVQVAAYAGDANGNGTYSGGDTTLLQRIVVGSGTSFTAFQLLDPVVLGDLNRSGNTSGGDTTLVQRLVVGTPIAEAPTVPVGLTPPPAGGPDPRLYIRATSPASRDRP